MKIIDFRFRPSTPDAVKGMLAKGGPFSPMFEYFNYKDRAKPEPIGQIVKEMEAQNVVKGVVIGRDAETTYGLKSSNPGILELMRQYPDRFIGFAGVDPIKGMDAITELKNRVERDGFRGAAIDPYLARIPADHRRFYPIYAKCCELNIPIVITTGPATLVRGAVMVVQRNANVYLDIAEYEQQPFSEKYIEAANTIISDKVIFSSAAPFMDFQEQIALYRSLPFTPEVLEKVMYKNACRILGLPE